MTENYNHIQDLANDDVQTLILKGKVYGSSWRKRGGVGAFMMLARKWDRIEVAAEAAGYDIFAAVRASMDKDGLRDDIQDLRAYLLLVESFVTAPDLTVTQVEEGEVDLQYRGMDGHE